MPVIQNKHSKPGNKHPKPLKKKSIQAKPKPQNPKQKDRFQNGSTKTRITKYQIESYSLKKTESFP